MALNDDAQVVFVEDDRFLLEVDGLPGFDEVFPNGQVDQVVLHPGFVLFEFNVHVFFVADLISFSLVEGFVDLNVGTHRTRRDIIGNVLIVRPV